MESATRRESLIGLFNQPGGLFGAAPCHLSGSDEPRVSLRVVRSGNLAPLYPELARRGSLTSVQAAGSGLDEDETLIPALAEAVERYSACVFREEQFIWATADELGQDALDVSTLPCCSESELVHPKCPLIKPPRTKALRWVRGVSLQDGRLIYVPAVMAYARTGYATPAERFWISNSTGCAAHHSYERALLAGIYEVVERDAISITWLQKLALPRIEINDIPPELKGYWQRCEDCLGHFEYNFFDATSDLEVPTVYGIQIAKHNRHVSTLVACSTGLSAADAIAKVMRDMAHLRFALQRAGKSPLDCDDFTDPLHGAVYMGQPDKVGAFDFILNTRSKKKLSDMRKIKNEEDALLHVVQMLRKKQLETYFVDLSTDEAVRCGLRVLRVIIPGLQPLSFRHRARFLGHPRLYRAPVSMGYPALPEDELNRWPQPFA